MNENVESAKELLSAMDSAGLLSISFRDAAFSFSASKANGMPLPEISDMRHSWPASLPLPVHDISDQAEAKRSNSLEAAISQDGNDASLSHSKAEAERPGVLISSPMVGTAYRSLEPSGEPLVSVGDSVKKGQALCAIEAMKMINEISSPCDGKVLEILFEDSSLAEYGAPLVLVGEGE